MKRLAVYCGSSMGSDPLFAETARALGGEMASRGLDLVYGGGHRGLMGVVADAVLAGGGKAFGVIPQALVDLEVAHRGLTELHTVTSMHERKAKMTELTDGFIAIPGGIGTLDELFEVDQGLTELHTVTSMHERKAKMTELTDGFIAIPGGIGTLDELFEAWTWNALGYHSKPFCLLNVAGFWDRMIEFLDHVTESGFMSPARRAQLLVASEIGEAIEKLDEAEKAAETRMVW